ncbi:MAG: DUF2459 domain-containing protein [Spirochaetes bacterium]|nr:DUF2459 domain-containing protein [Spirochaetota bacterium]
MLRQTGALVLIALVLMMPCLCAAGRDAVRNDGAGSRAVYILSNGFHTGIILEMNGNEVNALPFADSFRRYRYIDAGWGDEVFYQDPNPGLGAGVRALMVPTSSVVRIEGFNAAIGDAAAWSDSAVKVMMGYGQYHRLCEYIGASVLMGPDGAPVIASKRGDGVIFYKSTKKYDLFNTCNTWVAGGFRYAGLDISPIGVITARTLFRRLRNVGAVEVAR